MLLRKRLIFLAIALAASGCSILAPRPDFTRFYVLAALATPPADLDSDLSIAIGPLIVPDYLQRYEMVHRKSNTELKYTDNARWAETLPDGLGRTVAENVALLVGTKRVIVYPAPLSGTPDFSVPIEIIRFEPAPDGRVNLVARWVVRNEARSGEARRVEVRLSQILETPRNDSWKARSEAMSQAALRLSEEIAAAIRTAAGNR